MDPITTATPMWAMPDEPGVSGTAPEVIHWFDFLCPFCYVGQARNAILKRQGLAVVEQPMRAHPEISPGGQAIGPRSGPTYAFLEVEAARAGLELRWPGRLPDTRMALGIAEWVRVRQPTVADALRASLFAAHFAFGEDIGVLHVIENHAAEAGADLASLRDAVASGTADGLLLASERSAHRLGVRGTPAWRIRDRFVSGLQPDEVFEQLASG